jgi:heme oxygenase
VVQEALERALDEAGSREPRLARVFVPHHRRLEKFDADLTALNVAPRDRTALPETAKVAAWLQGLGEDQPLGLLGALYVLEGATNGGQFLSRALAPSLGAAPGSPGTLSLDPHGPATRELWGQFRTSIDAIGLNRQERDQVIAAAGETFDALTRIFDAVEGTRGPADGAAALTHV